MSEQDELIFRIVVPEDHRLRHIASCIDFESFRELLGPCYHATMGRPGDPVLLSKVIFLQYFYSLSDAQVIERLQTDMAFRWFVGLSLNTAPPDPSTLSYFRSRLKVEGTQKLMDSLILQAQNHGLLKYRLRLKDATHVLANIAIRATLPLAAEIREKVLAAARPFAAEQVAAAEARMVEIRAATAGCEDAVRLGMRLELLQDMLVWMRPLIRPADADGAIWQKFEQARDLLQKMLKDEENPNAGDRVRSAQDPDARRGKHGNYYDGYFLDILMDADSELITSINVLPANGYEGMDAVTLVEHEESVTGEDVKAISIDGAGSPGEIVRKLQDPEGLNLDVYVPYREPSPTAGLFGASEFQEDPERKTVTCPAGKQSHYQTYDKNKQGMMYRFQAATCTSCPLMSRCMSKPPAGRNGRIVRKSDYETEHLQTKAKAATPEYRAVKKEHAKVERKFSELINRHSARFARYRGLAKVHCQQLWTAITVNIKRLTKLILQGRTPTVCPVTQ